MLHIMLLSKMLTLQSKGNNEGKQMEIIVEPHVASSLLDHYQGKLGKNCRGWLIGSATANTVMVNNFVPDTFNRLVGVKPTLEAVEGKTMAECEAQHKKNLAEYNEKIQQYNKKLQQWFESIKSMFPRETTVVGFYSVGTGSVVEHSIINDNTETTIRIAYKDWSVENVANPYFVKRGKSVHLDVRIPSKAEPQLTFLGSSYTYKMGKATEPVDALVRLVPETRAANTVMDHIVRLAYGESVEDSSVHVLDLDHVLSRLADEGKVTDRIQQAFTTLEDAVSKTKDGNVTKLLTLLKQQQTEAAVANGETLSEVRMRNALMIKLVVTRLQEYLQVLEQSMVKGAQRGQQRFDRR